MTPSPRRGASAQGEKLTTPEPVPVQPTFSHPDQHSFILQSIMEMQKSLGGLEQAVNNLSNSSDKLGGKVDAVNDRLHGVEKKLYGAGLILVVVSALFSIFAPKVIDAIFNVLKTRPTP